MLLGALISVLLMPSLKGADESCVSFSLDRPQLIYLRRVALTHQLPAHSPFRRRRHAGQPNNSLPQRPLISSRTLITLSAIAGCECANRSSVNSPGSRISISRTSALLYLKPGRKRRLTASGAALEEGSCFLRCFLSTTVALLSRATSD